MYPFGVDYAWGYGNNELFFLKSFKLKLCLVIGILHQLLAIFLSGLNHVYFGQWLEFFCDF